MSQTQLLVTATTHDSVRAVVSAGADAVAVPCKKRFCSSVRTAKLFDRRAFILCDRRLRQRYSHQLMRRLEALYAEGADGIITHDMGIVHLVRKHFPQMNIMFSCGANLRNSMAVDTCASPQDSVILSPELSKEELRDVCTSMKSGFSCIVHGNLGDCLQGVGLKQLDRKLDKKMPLKDLCLLNQLDSLLALGPETIIVHDYRKSPFRLSVITKRYREAMDTYFAGNFEVSNEQLNELILTSDRNVTEGPFSRVKDVLNGRKQRKEGIYLGTIANHTLKLEAPLSKGETIVFYTGHKPVSFKVTYLLKNGVSTPYAESGDEIRLRYPQFRNGNAVYKTSRRDEELDFTRIPVTMHAQLRVDAPMRLQLKTHNAKVEVDGSQPVEQARQTPLNKERIAQQLGRLGDTDYIQESISIEMDEDSVVPFSELNKVRNRAVEALTRNLLSGIGRESPSVQLDSNPEASSPTAAAQHPRLHVRVYDTAGAEEAVKAGADLLYFDIFSPDLTSVQEICSQHGVPLYLVTPRLIHERELVHLRKLIHHYAPNGILVGNPGLLDEKLQCDKHLDYNFGVMHHLSQAFWQKPTIVSPHIDNTDMGALQKEMSIVFAYGKAPVLDTKYRISFPKKRAREYALTQNPYGDTTVYMTDEENLLHRVHEFRTAGFSHFYLDLLHDVAETVQAFRAYLDHPAHHPHEEQMASYEHA